MLLLNSMHVVLPQQHALDGVQAGVQRLLDELFGDVEDGPFSVVAKRLHFHVLSRLAISIRVSIKRLHLKDAQQSNFNYSLGSIHVFIVAIRACARYLISFIQNDEPQGFIFICSPRPLLCDHARHFFKDELRHAPLFRIVLDYLRLILTWRIIEARSGFQLGEQATQNSEGLNLGGGRFDRSPLRVGRWILQIVWAQLVDVIHDVSGDAHGDGPACGSAQLLAPLVSFMELPMQHGESDLAHCDQWHDWCVLPLFFDGFGLDQTLRSVQIASHWS